MFIEQPPKLFRVIYPAAIFRMDPNEKSVYLTFDDGPIPEVTPWVLNTLDKYKIKATFFMVGDNIYKHPDIFNMVTEKGHRLGNHTFNHLQGFKFTTESYLDNVKKANELIHTNLFRPPHGQLKRNQYHILKKHFKIIMWDLVTRDYSKKLTPEEVLHNAKHYVRNGSIITFHDSLKSWNNGNLKFALPKTLEYLLKQGYVFKTL